MPRPRHGWTLLSSIVIATIWDFDKTLTPGNMQGPLFRYFGIDEAAPWDEVDGMAEWCRNHGATLIRR